MPGGTGIYRDETRHVDWDTRFHDHTEPVSIADSFIARLQRG